LNRSVWQFVSKRGPS